MLLFDVSTRLVMSTCDFPMEKVSEFSDHVLKTVMKQSRSYIIDSGDLIKQFKEIKEVPKDFIMVTAEVVGLYPNIPQDVWLEGLRRILDDRVSTKIGTNDFIKMAEFVLKNKY